MLYHTIRKAQVRDSRDIMALLFHFFWKRNKYNFVSLEYYKMTLTLFQMTNFRLFQTERVCRGQCQIWWKWQKVLQKGRKHCGKWRNCSSQAISPFPIVFSKDLYCRHVKTRACLGKGWLSVLLLENIQMSHNVSIKNWFLTILTFNDLEKEHFENLMRKGEISASQHFTFSHNIFSPSKKKKNPSF